MAALRQVAVELGALTFARVSAPVRGVVAEGDGDDALVPRSFVEIDRTRMLVDEARLYAERLAAKAHYQLLHIYPFPRQSGKVARLVMNLLLLRQGYPPVILPATQRQRYYDALKPLCSDLEVWETIYQQPLTGKDPVAQYTSSTGLRPYLELLQEPERSEFYEAYAALLRKAYPTRPDGITLFPFRRLFIVARRA